MPIARLFRRVVKRVHIGSRLAALTAMVSLMLLAVAGLGAWQLRNLQLQSEQMLAANVKSIRATMELELHLQDLRHQLDRAPWMQSVASSDAANRAHIETLWAKRGAIDRWLKRTAETAFTAKERELTDRLQERLDAFYQQLRLVEAGLADDARDLRRLALEEKFENEVLPAALEYLDLDESLLEGSGANASTQTGRLVRWLLLVGVLGAVAASAAGYGLARAISQSLVQLNIPIQDVAGKLREVAEGVVVSTELDLSDVGPALARVAKEVTAVVSELQARHREMIHADQLASVGQLAAGIAHEIRNPLTSMKMLVQSAQRQGPDKLSPRDLQILDEEIRRLETLLTEFLDFAKPKPLEPSLVDLRGLVEGTAAFLQNQADARQVLLECSVPSEPCLAWVDAARIRQVLVNLLLNAIQITPPTRYVRLWLDEVDHDGRRFSQIKVSDEGPGISAEQLQRIFEPFYSTKETGLGLGLATSQRITLSHGGELYAETNAYGGADFVVVLPTAPSAAIPYTPQVAVRKEDAEAVGHRRRA